MEATTAAMKRLPTTATIKRRPGCAHKWNYKVYVEGKVCREHRILGGYPMVVFGPGHARSVAVTERDTEITHVFLDWCNRIQEVDPHGSVVN